MTDDEYNETTINLSRDFTRLEISLLIEALLFYRSSNERPILDDVTPEDIAENELTFTDIATREMTDKENDTLFELSLLFMAGFESLFHKESEKIVESQSKTLMSEIREFLKDK